MHFAVTMDALTGNMWGDVSLPALYALYEKAPEYHSLVIQNVGRVRVADLGPRIGAEARLGEREVVINSTYFWSFDPVLLAGALVHEAKHIADAHACLDAIREEDAYRAQADALALLGASQGQIGTAWSMGYYQRYTSYPNPLEECKERPHP